MTRRALLAALAALLLLLLTAPAAWESPRTRGAGPAATADALDAEARRWVETTLAKLSLEEKLGQLVMVPYYGGFTSAESEEYQALVRRIEQQHIGSVMVATRPSAMGTQLSQAYPTAALANQLQRRARLPLLIAADFERGTAMRISEGTGFPYAMAVAATGQPQDAYQMARITALEARAVGVHWNFAPVADVNVNPENPIINTRSFGEDAARVAAFAREYVRGTEENGVLSTAKHFPGHGDTSTDSHINLATIPGDRARLERVELAPFRAALGAGASAVMTGHLLVPALEPDPRVPATFSPRVIGGLLRGEMGFQGLVVTDALDMGGTMANFSLGDVAVRAMEAGTDMLLLPVVPDAVLLALREAVESGRLAQERIDASVRRVLEAKARVGLHRGREVDLEKLNEVFGRPEFRAAAEDIASRGVTLLRDTQRLLPLDATKPQRVLLVAIAGDPDALPAAELERELRWRAETVQTVRCDTRWVKSEWVKLPPASSYDVAVVAVFVRVADRKATVGLPANQAALVRQVLAAGKPAVVVGFGSPYLVERFPEAKTWLATFSTFEVNQRAAARALFGQTAIAGQLPVTVPGVAKLGDGLRVAAHPMTLGGMPADALRRLQRAFELAGPLMAGGQISGATLIVGHRNQTHLDAGGQDGGAPASLAPALTAISIAALFEQGLVQVDAPVKRYIPEYSGSPAGASGEITIRQLLQELAAPAAAGGMRQSAATTLKEVVRRVTGDPPERFLKDRLLRRLDVPEGKLFAERELAAFAQMMLNGGIYGHRRILRRSTIDLFTARYPVGGTARGLGWDVGPWSGGPLSRRAYGYDAENGASLWVDPEKELFIIFLPAEVKPGAEEKLRALRDPLHRAVVEALGLAAAPPAAR